ncbi:MAG: FecR domain-containing protein [Sphingobium sp.]
MGPDPSKSERNGDEPDLSVVEQAAFWLSHLGSGEADAADRAEFEAWRDADPAHALAVERMGSLHVHSPLEKETLRRLFLTPRRRAGIVVIPLLLSAGFAAWLAARQPAVQIRLADQRTGAGEVRPVALTDGSRIVLATDSAADLDVKDDRRTIRLLRGEVLAQVAHGRHVPFVVATADGTAEALGTAFTVRKQGEETIVSVIQSHVRACPVPDDGDRCIVLAPGERARMAGGAVRRLPAVDPLSVAAWNEGWLPVEDEPLVDVLDQLNRWRSAPVGFDRSALAGLRVSGILPLRDTDRALANLERSQPIRIDRSDPAKPRVERR